MVKGLYRNRLWNLLTKKMERALQGKFVKRVVKYGDYDIMLSSSVTIKFSSCVRPCSSMNAVHDIDRQFCPSVHHILVLL